MRLSSGGKVNARLSKEQNIRDRVRPLTKVAGMESGGTVSYRISVAFCWKIISGVVLWTASDKGTFWADQIGSVAGIHQGNAQVSVSVEAQESEYLSLGMIGFAKLIQIAQQSFGTSISCESSIERAKHHLKLQKVLMCIPLPYNVTFKWSPASDLSKFRQIIGSWGKENGCLENFFRTQHNIHDWIVNMKQNTW
jgi:hypothetical protein